MRDNFFKKSIWLLLIPAIVGIIGMDLQYKFGNSDLPFFLTIGVYLLFILLSRAQSKTTAKIVLFMTCMMGISFIASGASRFTERLGEWFYIFFAMGLLQYTIESWQVEEK